jgi:hypothetical protein
MKFRDPRSNQPFLGEAKIVIGGLAENTVCESFDRYRDILYEVLDVVLKEAVSAVF